MDQYCNETVVSFGDTAGDYTLDGLQEISQLDINNWHHWMRTENPLELWELKQNGYTIRVKIITWRDGLLNLDDVESHLKLYRYKVKFNIEKTNGSHWFWQELGGRRVYPLSFCDSQAMTFRQMHLTSVDALPTNAPGSSRRIKPMMIQDAFNGRNQFADVLV